MAGKKTNKYIRLVFTSADYITKDSVRYITLKFNIFVEYQSLVPTIIYIAQERNINPFD